MPENVYQTRDAIEDVWGMRTPYKHEWPTRVDARYTKEPDKWVQSACVLCRYAEFIRILERIWLTCIAMAVVWTLASRTVKLSV